MISEPLVPTLFFAAATAVIVIAVVVASPLTACVLALVPLAGYAVAGGLPAGERRALLLVLGAAFGARLALIAAQLVAGIPVHTDTGVSALAGDEAYYLSRALRNRDLLAGIAATKYDFFVASDEYGRTSYLSLLTALQVIFGPTPYAMKAVNALLFVTGAALLFRLARRAFGQAPAFVGLVLLLFLPSLLVSSVSLLKESLYFFVAAVFLAAVVSITRHARAGEWRATVAPMVVAALALWVLNDLRRGAVALALASLAAAAIIRATAGSRRRVAATAALAAAAAMVVAFQPSLRDRAMNAVTTTAKMHVGHVFTVGHAYKLLDEDFYKYPEASAAWSLKLTPAQALRFVARSAVSVIVTPWPWEMRSRSELAFMPELVLWYVLALAFPIGLVAGWRLDRDAVSLLAGMTVTTAAVVAVTTGNVGTLLRLRGLIVPSMIWISAIGLCAIAQWWLARRATRAGWLTASPQGAQS